MLTARGQRGVGDELVTPLRRALMSFVMLAAVALIFVQPVWLVLSASAALALFLALCWRQFSVGTWVPVILSLAGLALALHRGVPATVLTEAAERMLFLAALIAMLGTLRSAASLAPEVGRAGVFLTSQPASRRYLALNFGGHLFGVLINFGGLALLLDLASRSMSSEATASLPPEAQEAKLRRMTMAILRGFGMISLWSPFGFATNAILITLPGISYVQFGPIGFAMSFVFVAIGWAFDRWQGRRFRQMGLPRPSPPANAWIGAAILVGHVVTLGAAVFLLHGISTLGFQQALIIAVPVYSVIWAAVSTRAQPAGPAGGMAQVARATWRRLSGMGAEVGVFASAGFLPVILLALIPVDDLRAAVAMLGLGAVTLALGLAVSIVLLAMLGVNPIVSASVLGAIAVQLAVPGLSETAIALAITGGWTTVIGLSPFMTTIIICAAIIDRPVGLVGPVWNGPYCLTILAVWSVLLSSLMISGAI